MTVFSALGRALGQLDDPVFRRVILYGFLWSMAVFIALLAGLISLLPLIPATGIGWLDIAISWTAGLSAPLFFIASIWLLFPAVMTMVLSLLLDDVVDAVEARHYPESAGWRRSPPMESVWLAVRMSLLVILVNIVALPAYLVLLFTAVGAPLLYLLLNGWLMGREYFEMVAVRHATLGEAGRLRARIGGDSFIGGLAIAGLFLVPFLNLIAPVIGAALMVHQFHAARERGVIAP